MSQSVHCSVIDRLDRWIKGLISASISGALGLSSCVRRLHPEPTPAVPREVQLAESTKFVKVIRAAEERTVTHRVQRAAGARHSCACGIRLVSIRAGDSAGVVQVVLPVDVIRRLVGHESG